MLSMKQMGSSTKAVSAALFITLFAASCKNEDKKEEPVTLTTVTTDTTTSKTPTEADSVKTTVVTTTTVSMGKPNPAKKGGKGKTRIVFTNPTAATGKMEMDKQGIYNRADVMPAFPGGEKALVKFMEDNIQYPQAAIDEGVEGQIQLQFAVDENGKVYSPVLVSDKVGYGLEEEAMRVVQKMPKWNPGNIKGKNVKTRFTLPVSFVIN